MAIFIKLEKKIQQNLDIAFLFHFYYTVLHCKIIVKKIKVATSRISFVAGHFWNVTPAIKEVSLKPIK